MTGPLYECLSGPETSQAGVKSVRREKWEEYWLYFTA